MSQIQNSIEFKFADIKIKAWVNRLSDSQFDLNEQSEILAESFKFTIQTNIGILRTKCKIHVTEDMSVIPNLRLDEGRYYLALPSEKHVDGVFFTVAEFERCIEVIAVRIALKEEEINIINGYHVELRRQIYDKLPLTAKRAISDGVQSMCNTNTLDAYAWFVSHDFKNIPPIAALKNYGNDGNDGNDENQKDEIDWISKSFLTVNTTNS